MAKKLTIEFVREQFEKELYILLTKKYKDPFRKLKYICPKGHKGSIRWNNWQQGQRCGECGGKKKLTINFIKNEFKKEGYILLTKKYINAHQKLNYVCSKGHEGTICWSDWQQGCRCFECFGSKKLTISFVREQFEKEGYILISKEYINAFQKLDYICPKGHKSKINWHGWQRGQRCHRCYFERNRGKNHYNWDLNLTNEDRLSRRLVPGYREWRTAVYERDNFTCQVCGDKRGGNLISHHLESYTGNPKLRLEVSNGICLCEKCHKRFHSEYSYVNNTKEQFMKFVNKYNKQATISNV